MAGGEGTRFAPLSTPERPKQFLSFIGKKSFLRQTFDRISTMVDAKNIYVSTNARYLEIVKAQLPEVPACNLIGEPKKKNTAPALVFTTLEIYKRNPNATIICLPSDHFIRDEEKFRGLIADAVALALTGRLVTLGMRASWASPEYGYIEPAFKGQGWSLVGKFVEKPSAKLASEYLREGYFWNGGIFVWRAKVFLDEVKMHSAELVPGGSFDNFASSIDSYFDSVPSISVDYALMEKTRNAAVIPAEIGWSDVGTWEGLRRLHSDFKVEINPEVLSFMNSNPPL